MCLALQRARDGIRVQQLHDAVGRAVLQAHLTTGPSAEAFLQVPHGLPPGAEGPGHLHHSRVQRQGQRHGHDEHRVEDDEEGADGDLVPERPLFVVHQEDVVPGEGAVVEGGDEGEEEDHGGAGDAPQDDVGALAHAEAAAALGALARLALCVQTLPGLGQVPELLLRHREVNVHQLTFLLAAGDGARQSHVAAIWRKVPATSCKKQVGELLT